MICDKCKKRPALNSSLCHHCSLLVDNPKNVSARLQRDFQKRFSYIYFVDINHGEQIKIGITSQPFERIRTYRRSFETADPIGFIAGAINKEREIQNLFRFCAVNPETRNCEWFYWNQSIIDYALKKTKSVDAVYREILEQWKLFKAEAFGSYGEEVHPLMDLPACLTSRLK